VVVSLLLVNLIISGARIWEQLAESETLTMISLFWSAAELTVGSLSQFVLDVVSIAPIGHILLLALNVLVLGYVGIYVPRIFAKTKHRTVA
jgi:maltodextrin utilization protein YvdJ